MMKLMKWCAKLTKIVSTLFNIFQILRKVWRYQLDNKKNINRWTDNTTAKGTSTTQETNDRATRKLLTTEGEHRCSGWGSTSCFTCGTCRVTMEAHIFIGKTKLNLTTYNDTWYTNCQIQLQRYAKENVVIIIKSPNLAMLTSSDKQTVQRSLF